MLTIMFQLQTSPPQVAPLPGQSVSLKQPSVASALCAENKATEPTKVAKKPRRTAFIPITSREARIRAQRWLFGNHDRAADS
jgi:hypothetical protein